MIDILGAIGFLLLFGTVVGGIFLAFIEDTDTFRAIDEKIAKLIRGKDDE